MEIIDQRRLSDLPFATWRQKKFLMEISVITKLTREQFIGNLPGECLSFLPFGIFWVFPVVIAGCWTLIVIEFLFHRQLFQYSGHNWCTLGHGLVSLVFEDWVVPDILTTGVCVWSMLRRHFWYTPGSTGDVLIVEDIKTVNGLIWVGFWMLWAGNIIDAYIILYWLPTFSDYVNGSVFFFVRVSFFIALIFIWAVVPKLLVFGSVLMF